MIKIEHMEAVGFEHAIRGIPAKGYRKTKTGYETLLNMYHARNNHKLDEWREFCKEIEKLPYFKELIGQGGE